MIYTMKYQDAPATNREYKSSLFGPSDHAASGGA